MKTETELFDAIRSKKLFGEPKRIVHTATVLHKGWEMDNELWIVMMADGDLMLFGTSHGGVYLFNDEQLNAKIAETEASLKSLQKTMAIMDCRCGGQIPSEGDSGGTSTCFPCPVCDGDER